MERIALLFASMNESKPFTCKPFAGRDAGPSWNQVQATITVLGWLRPDGKLWDVTDNVTIEAPSLFPNEDGTQTLGIRSVRYSQDDENGTTTTLECCLPNALTTLANPNVPTDANGGLLTPPALGTAKPTPPDTSSTSI